MAHLTSDELLARLADAQTRLAVGERYAHYKNPDHIYRITGFGVLESNDGVGVIYEPEQGDLIPFIRPVESFLESVEVNGERVPRFQKV